MAKNKYEDIFRELRSSIISGKFSPGDCLPTRSELQKQFDACNQTIQMAMNSLKADGLVLTNRSGGTIVAQNPPYLSNYGMVSCIPFASSRYTIAMQQAAERLSIEGLGNFSYYYYEQAHIQAEGYKRLIADVEAHRLAGLIFPFPFYGLEETIVIKQLGLPRISNAQLHDSFDIPQILLTSGQFLEKAVNHMMAQGRKKIALIKSYLHREEMENDIDYLVKRGVSSPILTQDCGATNPWSAHQTSLLLMSLPKKERPDGIIIGDDNLVESATEGIAKSGARVPDELTVIAYSNFPNRVPSCIPVTRLGLDCVDLLRQDLECLEMQRQGKKIPKVKNIYPIFESEIRNGKISTSNLISMPNRQYVNAEG